MDYIKIVYLLISLTFSYLLFFVVTPWVFSDLIQYKMKNISKLFSKQLSIEIVKGACQFGNKGTVNTSLKTKANYINIPESMNKENGIEFSYSFWMKLDAATIDQIIFTRGIYQQNTPSKKSLLNVIKSEDKSDVAHTKVNADDISQEQFIKCPLVKITTDALGIKNFSVSFNTLRKINNIIDYTYEDILNSSRLKPRWFLFAIAFREGPYTTDYGLDTKGIIVDLYVNEQLVKSKYIENDSLKLNEGDIHIFPEAKDSPDHMFGNLNYHNFALSIVDVEKIWKRGFDDTGCDMGSRKNNNINRQMNDLSIGGFNSMF